MCIGLHVKYALFLSDLNRQIFEKYSHKIPRKSMRHDEANSHFRNLPTRLKTNKSPAQITIHFH